MRSRSQFASFAMRVVCASTFLVPVLAVSAVAPLLMAQAGAKQRTVDGKVTGKGDAGLDGAVVYLKDTRTLALKSFITPADGTFRFGQLSPSTDYEIYAEHGGKKSKTKSISSFDNKNDFHLTLQID